MIIIEGLPRWDDPMDEIDVPLWMDYINEELKRHG